MNTSPVHDDPYARPFVPLLVVISGPSGVGKDTIILELQRRHWPFHFVVTTTTRPPRATERNGVDYFFVSLDEFAELINQQELLEYAVVYGDYKGIPKQQVRDAITAGKDVIMRLDVQGAATIKRLAPEALLIYVSADSEEELVSRLVARKTDSPESVKIRIATAREEMKRLRDFDYCVINRADAVQDAVDDIMAIIRAEHARTAPRHPVVL